MGSKIFQKYRIQNCNGLYAEICNFGAKILSLHIPDKHGISQDILIGFDDDQQYFFHDPYLNGICGRFAGRIGNGSFMLNGKTIELTKNEGKHQLHGGFGGFHIKFWEIKEIKENKITLYYFSKDGEEGFPGNLKVWITYELDSSNQFIIRCKAETDKATVVNLCQHAYFNLNGGGKVYEHLLHIKAAKYTEFDQDLINTGKLLSVEKTPLDFRVFKSLESIDKDPFFAHTLGIDHCFSLSRFKKNGGLVEACKLYSPQSGIELDIYTNQPALVVYTGNFIEDQIGKKGVQNGQHTAICLETQAFPNSPNIQNFPTTQLNPGEVYLSTTCWKFSTTINESVDI
ncbi:MAG: galactose-1-epimerase [Bacteroidetes bacterium HGW-Bacteroidetes-20]|nr:MAG: galactose-1-epimerase [Bacteroidetes bacterium HGW-Bacteroidetes-20]